MSKRENSIELQQVLDRKRITVLSVVETVAPGISLGAFLLLWLLVSKNNSDVLPPPGAVWTRLMNLFERPIGGLNIFGHIWVSLRRVLLALFASMTLGISFGILIGWNRTAKLTLGALFELFRPIPPIAWLPIVIMWFGIGEFPKILVVFIGMFTALVINSYVGMTLVEPLYLNVGRAFKATRRQLLTEIAIPSALPAIFAGIRNATSGGWMVVLAAEMIGAKQGCGFMITRGMEFYDVPLIVLGMVVIGIVGALLAILTNYIEKWVCPWNRKLGSE